MSQSLPDYVKASVPNPQSARGPWYKNTAPAYFGIFLWFPFYLTLAQQTLRLRRIRKSTFNTSSRRARYWLRFVNG